MSGSAGSAALCINLLWLLLFLRGGRLGHAAAAAIALVAAGVGPIHGHVLFALPFLLALLSDRRWALAALYGCAYSAGHLAVAYWPEIAANVGPAPDAGPTATDGSVAPGAQAARFVWPDLTQAGLNLLRLFGWMNLIVVPLLFVAVRPVSRVPVEFRLLAFGVLAAMAASLVIPDRSDPGPGFQALHGHLGSLALLATLGWVRLSAEAPHLRLASARALGLSCAAMLLIALPLRAYQVERSTAAVVASIRHVQAIDTDVVLVDLSSTRRGTALLRNDPSLANRPKIIGLQMLTPEQLRALCRSQSVSVVDGFDLAGFGMATVDRTAPGWYEASERDRALRAITTGPRCAGG